MIRILGPKDPKNGMVINTTSRDKRWGKQLSPFFLGPVKIMLDEYNIDCRNMENAWQYSKVYKEHLGHYEEWKMWALRGYMNPRAQRYPMGKGAVPEFSYWRGKKLTYIQARKAIYIPQYARLVSQTSAFKTLKEMHESGTNFGLWDFDGYRYDKLGMSFHDVIHSEDHKMGHAFVIAMLLEDYIDEQGKVCK